MNIIEQLEQEEIARLGKTIPRFAPGDTVVVQVKVKEGTRERLQAYEGVVIAKRNRGLNSSFIVRKISSGEGVERTFQTYSPLVAPSKSSAVVTFAAPSCTTCVIVPASRPASRKSWSASSAEHGLSCLLRQKRGGVGRLRPVGFQWQTQAAVPLACRSRSARTPSGCGSTRSSPIRPHRRRSAARVQRAATSRTMSSTNFGLS